MTFEQIIAFAAGMAFWMALPGPGLALVVSRALGAGRRAGLVVITGLVLADVVFLGIAFVGLLAIAAAMGPMFLVVKYAGAAYLIWRCYRLIVAKESVVDVKTARRSGLWKDIGLGLLATLSNPKAIQFFGVLMPTLIAQTVTVAVNICQKTGQYIGVQRLKASGDMTRVSIGARSANRIPIAIAVISCNESGANAPFFMLKPAVKYDFRITFLCAS